MDFGFTHWSDTCPKMTEALKALAELDAAEAERVVPVSISVDLEHDMPEALRSDARHFHPRLVELMGTPRELDRLGRAYGAFFTKMERGQRGSTTWTMRASPI